MNPVIKQRLGTVATWVTISITAASIGLTYLASATHNPAATTAFGVTFSKQFAEYLGLDWKQAYTVMLDDLGVRYIRIPTYWEEIEPTKDRFSFADIDWQVAEANKRGAKLIMAIGRRQPRWPECHDPEWLQKIQDQSGQESRKELLEFMSAVVTRYKDNRAVEVWQVENEPFLNIFGECPKITTQELREEIELVRSIDPHRHVMATDSGELSSWRKTIYAADLFGTTMYRRTYTQYLGYTTYWWVPPSYYRIKAALWRRPLETVYGVELQGEPWFSGDPKTASVDVVAKTMSPQILQEHIDYARRSELPRSYFWGVEWWYFMKTKNGDSSYWDVTKPYFAASRQN